MPLGLMLAPLRGVTIRCFRETFAEEIRAAGFVEAVTPFVAALPGFDPLKDRELRSAMVFGPGLMRVTPQLIGKDPEALRQCLERIRAVGYETADLNCGCPFPMVRNKGRGSGLLRTPETLRRMLDVGCAVMGPGKFSIKVRLGVDRPDELQALLPMLNEYPLRYLAVHARTARQMYAGDCDRRAFDRIAAEAAMPVVYNGDVSFPVESVPPRAAAVMIGRGFVRALGRREDSRDLVLRYLEASRRELCGDRPVLGRLKELLAYWGADARQGSSRWVKRWNLIKVCRSLDELQMVI